MCLFFVIEKTSSTYRYQTFGFPSSNVDNAFSSNASMYMLAITGEAGDPIGKPSDSAYFFVFEFELAMDMHNFRSFRTASASNPVHSLNPVSVLKSV